ncbi:N-acetyltransferase [Paraoerskovia sediminicola]|uniref:N-acetyltransferase n=1 Tax=Paraoerskovia sediminicola TaxID=1138587 RepID=A0ABN6XG07_9CELL|nr:N-acetyltransferase [Paraoerskovia sediminicola]BDZ43023.1 N-acetyltransferase [Paraoerskovia sediminicola]
METTIRRATAADLEGLVELAAATFPLACPEGTAPEAITAHVAAHLGPESFARWTASADHVLLVAEDADVPGRLAGYALLACYRTTDPGMVRLVGEGPAVELSKIYVRADAHGSGVATALLAAGLDLVSTTWPDAPVWLGTHSTNLRAQRFYRKHDFELAGTRTFFVGDEAQDDVVMLRRVPTV